MHALRPCTDCNRHVRSESHACHFCGAELTPVERAPQRSTRGLTRAVIFAGATLLIPACGGGSDETIREQESEDTSGGGTDTVHGTDGQTGDGQTTDGQTTVTDDNVNVAQPYGAPPAEDLARTV